MTETLAPALAEAVARMSTVQIVLCVLAMPVIGVLFLALQGKLPWVRSDEDGAIKRTRLLFDAMQDELQRLRGQIDAFNLQIARYGDELDKLRTARVLVAARAGELFDAAVAARVMVHDLERRLRLPETAFPPLSDIGLK